MKIKCMHCETIYEQQRGACPSCGKQGGYAQQPSCKQVGDLNLHLEEILQHKESKNQYQIKELQGNGMIATLHYSPAISEMARKGVKVYISNTAINEYVRV